MIWMPHNIYDEDSRSNLNGYLNAQFQQALLSRHALVQEYLGRALILLDDVLAAYEKCNGETFRTFLPRMSALAHGLIDHLHIAAKITCSIKHLTVFDIEYPSGRALKGPFGIADLNPELAERLHTRIDSLEAHAQAIKGVRDTAHHVDERINGMCGRRRIEMPAGCGLQVGSFGGGDTLHLTSMSVAMDSPSKTKHTVPGYLARVELSHDALDSLCSHIDAVFNCLGSERN